MQLSLKTYIEYVILGCHLSDMQIILSIIQPIKRFRTYCAKFKTSDSLFPLKRIRTKNTKFKKKKKLHFKQMENISLRSGVH
ncbi:hypothetical protein EUGRSUZ_F02221 [Eucalyptus grandis]|uniref:Uncharacterized protein n=2 Tax=Eucalyptus grandis TaxID=71139 RepID=A0ACC3KH93_EUCGR|nr:hypothetical protein EUGRSUZ_F02221 [Eucalyptus grandis]